MCELKSKTKTDPFLFNNNENYFFFPLIFIKSTFLMKQVITQAQDKEGNLFISERICS